MGMQMLVDSKSASTGNTIEQPPSTRSPTSELAGNQPNMLRRKPWLAQSRTTTPLICFIKMSRIRALELWDERGVNLPAKRERMKRELRPIRGLLEIKKQ